MKTKKWFENTDDKFTGILEMSDGTWGIDSAVIYYFKNGLIHREDGPAKIWLSGTSQWFLNDNLLEEINSFGTKRKI